ncbi:MAG: hypothetical protein AB7O66_23220 [Limisphaerales bacterium]
MSDDPISVIDLAAQHGIRKQSVFKALNRLGIEPTKGRGGNSRGQIVAYITAEEARIVVDTLRSGASSSEFDADDPAALPEALLTEHGVFYLLALEPDIDPGRFKVGFAVSLPERLRQLRCSAPFAKVVATWPCKRLWERTAIDSVADGSVRLNTEVFRAASLETVRDKCERFFSLMPRIAEQ